MGRSVDRLAGLALIGRVTFANVSFSCPGILGSVVDGEPAPSPGAPVLRIGATTSPGERSIEIETSEGRLGLIFPIPTPETTMPAGEVHAAAPEVCVVHAPLDPASLEQLRSQRPQLVVLANGRTLMAEGEPFVAAIRDLRRAIGASPLLWVPRVALPNRLALLVYLGIDLLDDTEARWRAADGIFLDPVLGTLDPAVAREEQRCSCPACREGAEEYLDRHARAALADELKLVRATIRAGRLRELVEARLTSEPLLAELLRYTDRLLADDLESRTPVIGEETLAYVTVESHRRPEIRRFRSRFVERYVPPSSKQVLLLLPCSRTKPYRRSRSHRRFARALEGLPGLGAVHVASVTSPLGVVPRELEDVYPAKNYDIPVTGEWSESERTAVIDAIGHLTAHGNYAQVVVHLDPEEFRFLRTPLDTRIPSIWTLEDHHSTTNEALAHLRRSLEDALALVHPPQKGALSGVREELHALARFQFGAVAADRLFAAPVKLQGRPWFQRLTDGHGLDLATWREERGLFHLTVAGGARIIGSSSLEVRVHSDVKLTGDLFGPGVGGADTDIRVGDAVVLVRDGQILGVGEAALPGAVMAERPHGLAVRVRHRVHEARPGTTDTDLAENSSIDAGPVV